MAELRFFKSIFDDKFETCTFDCSKSIIENVEPFVCDTASEMVECYDTETGKTFYAPLEEDNENHLVVVVNGKSVPENYEVQNDDIVNVMYVPLSNYMEGTLSGAVAGAGVFTLIGLLAGGGLGALIGFGLGALFGGVTGFFVDYYLGGSTQKTTNSEEDEKGKQQPDVKGASNTSLLNNPYPFVMGKHLVSPRIVADPYTEYIGEKGQDAYIRLVYCMGYAPLKLTDFKFGDFFLAYNRSQGVERKTIMNGTLKGYSESGEDADSGDILDRWRNNDIELELIQQHNCATEVSNYFQSRTEIDLTNRPLIPGTQMIAAGWTDVGPDDISSVYSSIYSNEDETYCVVVTPIVDANTILTPEQLAYYGNELVYGRTIPYEILLADFSGEGCIEEAENYAEALHDHLAEVELHEQEINYGHIYPEKIVQSDISANVFFICDEKVKETAKITYKGAAFPTNFRTNGVWFTESCPMEFTITLNARNGLYASRSHTKKSGNTTNNETLYESIPLWFCIQWRPYDRRNNSSDSTGADYTKWQTITNWNEVPNSPCVQTFNRAAMENDVSKHKGNDLRNSITTEEVVIQKTKVADNDLLDEMLAHNTYMYFSQIKYSSGNMFFHMNNTYVQIDATEFVVGNLHEHSLSISDFKSAIFINGDLYVDWSRPVKGLSSTLELIKENTDIITTIPCERTLDLYDASVYDYTWNGAVPSQEHITKSVTIKNIKVVGNYYLANEVQNGLFYEGFMGNVNLVNFQSFSGENGKDQMRFTGKVTLTKQECLQMIDPNNTTKSIEVRVIRVSPNYLNEQTSSSSTKSNDAYGAYSYSDVITVDSITTKVFDEDKLRRDDELVPVMIQREADMEKFCYVAIKAKADIGQEIYSSLKELNCIAESFSPVWDTNDKKWYPENVEKVTKYYGTFADYTITDLNLNDGVPNDENVYFILKNNEYEYVNSSTPQANYTLYIGVMANRDVKKDEYEISKSDFEKGRRAGFNWVKDEKGTNYSKTIRQIAIGPEEMKNEYPVNYMPIDAEKYIDSTSASSFMLAAVGPQLGKYASSYKDIDLLAMGEWWEDCQEVRDGSTYPYDVVDHKAGEEVITKYEANGFIYANTKKETLLKEIASTGRAVVTYDELGRIKVIMDKPVDYISGVINSQNCIDDSVSFSFAELPAGYQITFNDENDGFVQNVLYCWADGNDINNYKGVVSPLQLKYVTNPYQAHSLGRYYLANSILSRQASTIKVGPEGRLFPLGSVVAVQSEVLLLGDKSARIQETIEIDNYIYGIIVDNPIINDGETEVFDGQTRSTKGIEIFQPRQYGKSQVVTLRFATVGTTTPDSKYKMIKGTTNVILFANPVVRYRGSDGSYSSAIKYDFRTNDIVMFGTMNKISQKYRVIKVKPDDKGTFTETLIIYNEDVYNFGCQLPVFQNHMSIPQYSEPMMTLDETASTVAEAEEKNSALINQALFASKSVEIVAPDGIVFKNGQPQSLTLNCETKGFEPTSYQWYKNNTAILGATSASLTVDSEGVYKVEVDEEYIDYVTVINVDGGSAEPVYTCELAPNDSSSSASRFGYMDVTVYKDGSSTTETLYCQWQYEKFKQFSGSTIYYEWVTLQTATLTNGTGTLQPDNQKGKRGWRIRIYKDSQCTDLLCTANYSNGQTATIYLEQDVTSVNHGDNGYSPQKIHTYGKQKLGEETGGYTGYFKISYAKVSNPTSNQWTTAYTSQNAEAEYEWTVALNSGDTGTIKLIKCQLYSDSNLISLLEEDIITVVENGQSYYSVSLSNENFSVSTKSDLKPTSSANASVVFRAFKGATELEATNSTITTGQFKVTTPSGQGGYTISQSTAGTLVFAWNMANTVSESISVPVTITFDDGSTMTKTVNINASRQGTQGEQGADGGYQKYMFCVADFGQTKQQLVARTDWTDEPPTVPSGKCLYMATKWIEGE